MIALKKITQFMAENILNHCDEEIQSNNVTAKRCAKCVQTHRHFIQRFKKEYLLALLEQHSYVKRKNKQPSKLGVGKVAIIKDENVNRLS